MEARLLERGMKSYKLRGTSLLIKWSKKKRKKQRMRLKPPKCKKNSVKSYQAIRKQQMKIQSLSQRSRKNLVRNKGLSWKAKSQVMKRKENSKLKKVSQVKRPTTKALQVKMKRKQQLKKLKNHLNHNSLQVLTQKMKRVSLSLFQ